MELTRREGALEARPPLKLRLDDSDSRGGLLRAALIMGLWATLLALNLSLPWEGSRWAWAALFVVAQTWLYTGLFITAHDAMHGVVDHRSKRRNDLIGALAVRLYAMFSYQKLREAHHEHHRSSGTADDPDFDERRPHQFWRWYLRFLRRYISGAQLVWMALIFNVLAHIVGVEEPKLLIFWVLPSLLSTLQLFYFGTYLPHRGERFEDEHRARSNAYRPWVSLISCFHFGYHWEHHAYPSCPWWRLPQVRERSQEGAQR